MDDHFDSMDIARADMAGGTNFTCMPPGCGVMIPDRGRFSFYGHREI